MRSKGCCGVTDGEVDFGVSASPVTFNADPILNALY